ncbi:MAG TPA: hypothetical protein VGC47_05655 [Acidimicrobiia bacterium]|jgi:hypothetical protein
MTIEEIASAAEAVLVAKIVDVKRSRVNTADGIFPSAAELGESPIGDLIVLTDVEVDVTEMLRATSPELNFDEGASVALTIGGGSYTTVLSAEQADILGMTGDHDSAALDAELVPQAADDLTITYGNAPAASLAEGEVVVLFLVEHQIDGFGDTPQLTLLAPVHPDAILRPDGVGGWLGPGGEAADLPALIELVGP